MSPVQALLAVTATDSTGHAVSVVPETNQGGFFFETLGPGRHTLTFTPASGYTSPPARVVSVIGGVTTSVGVIAVR
ncbi:hypothetical protein [Hymenobacter volaticus]|uniref:Carboxypeptidase regulatory-like domain-containing protein n=1 Tax=Hymenobacter volaticus TaxID=2932254 RepID=A0ABY4GEG1_9BACT|nr:hypothetical protein [Hymenobacter volaticus]UOQ69243.1 hypothetical protein MUN86_27710 [Hymenobacter volaticus]